VRCRDCVCRFVASPAPVRPFSVGMLGGVRRQRRRIQFRTRRRCHTARRGGVRPCGCYKPNMRRRCPGRAAVPQPARRAAVIPGGLVALKCSVAGWKRSLYLFGGYCLVAAVAVAACIRRVWTRAAMAIQALFPTLVYSAPLRTRAAAPFNQRLLRECRQLRVDDAAGRRLARARIIRAATPLMGRSTACMKSTDIRHPKTAAPAHLAAFARKCRVGSARPQTGDDRLLGEHHAAWSRAQPAPASAVERQRHLLRAGARGKSGHQV